ncbi:antitermination protein NusB [Arthrobacter cheniae]|uniref:Antitermination protein NusB n=1 Tax=Arthrobacter cheniae TaxID=1258888 RepID=A0A3A5M0I7_9MICC|nr:antitermination protein NusB [Arthrobacter cheniae]
MNDYAGSEGAFFWFAVAVINAGLAEHKNRSRLAWFFLSLFFGPFATLLIVVMRPARPVPRSTSRRGRKP